MPLSERAQRLALGLTLLPSLLYLGGCAQTTQARSVEKSGFLGDYSMLRSGGEGQMLLRYRDESVDWTIYDSAIIDSVTVWAGRGTEAIDAEEAQALSGRFYNELVEEIGKVVSVTTAPGANTLRIRAAITGGEDSAVLANTLTTLMLPAKILASLAPSTAVFVGEASVEIDVRDSVTDYRIAAGVDRRVGTKTYRGMLSNWSDVEQALDFWARELAKALARIKGVEYPE
jgi:hypothetical protein